MWISDCSARTAILVDFCEAAVRVPIAIGGQDGEVLPAGKLFAADQGTVRTVSLRGGLGIIVAGTTQGAAQRRTVTGKSPLQAAIECRPVGAAEQPVIVIDWNRIGWSVARHGVAGGIAVPDGIEADADIFAQIIERLADAGLGDFGAGAVIGIPVGEILFFLVSISD